MHTNLQNQMLSLLLIMAVMSSTTASFAARKLTVTKPGCPSQCANLTIPYPFGIGASCSLDPYYSLECDTSYNPPRAFTEKLNSSSTRFRVFDISEAQILVNGMIAYSCLPPNATDDNIISSKNVTFLSPSDSPFTLSNQANVFSMAGSCDYLAPLTTPGNYTQNITCPLSCLGKIDSEFVPGVCSVRNGCCKRPIRETVEKGFSLNVGRYPDKVASLHTPCAYVFIGREDSLVLRYESDFSDPAFVSRSRDNVPMVIDWVIRNQTCNEARGSLSSYACHQNSRCVDGLTGGYRCKCHRGYEGNPYLSPGCTDKNECAGRDNPCYKKAVCTNSEGGYNCTCPNGYHGDGHTIGTGCKPNSIFMLLPFKLTISLSLSLLSILIIVSGAYILIRNHKLAKTREKFYRQNGGLMLKEKLSSIGSGGIYDSFKLFTMEEVKKATKNFSKDLVVGIGGYGTVYKGTLQDKSLVAVKTSKIVDNTQNEQFINELVILTQIHHRNVVRLLGCCLEAEVPILVYEFVANGSLLEHIHGKSTWLSWNNRLQIATETATALGYLHSAASTPIIHRDIKSSNILLDENYVAKISDFGASRLIPTNQTQMSTLVQGTLGYMDPEYLLTSQLKDKSDVYSFGVVIAELLTGEKPLSADRRMENRNLAKKFVASFKEGTILDIIDARIVKEAPKEQLIRIAEIVKECLNVKGVHRPAMKDLAAELASLERQTITSKDDHNFEENGNLRKDALREEWSSSVSDFSFTIEAR